MSPLCQLEMTLPGGLPGVFVWGDGFADELWRAFAARGSTHSVGSGDAGDEAV
jgi:hypothetical protein